MALLELAAAVPVVVAYAARRAVHLRDEALPGVDRPVGPAYDWLRGWTREERATLLDVADRLNLNPAALAVVFHLESRGDPSAPKGDPKKKKLGTPRAGLIQITVGGRLPGLDTAAKVWAVREWPVIRQLREVVLPFFERYKGRSERWTAFDLYQRNFLPIDVGKPLETRLGVKGSSEPVGPGQKLTRGAVYAANPGFDPPPKKGYFTWADVKRKVDAAEREGGGKLVTVSGQVIAPGAAATQVARSTGEPPSEVSPAIRRLLRQINERWPRRSKASDGTLPDAAHRARCAKAGAGTSLCAHSEGRALDVTLDPESGPDLDALAEMVLGDPRVQLVIWNSRIANRDVQGGAWRPYGGPGKNPHERHAHFEVRPGARDDDGPWRLPPATARPRQATAARDLSRVVQGWRDGLVDNVYWRELWVGPYLVRVATDALSIAGVRLPVTFEEVLELAKIANYLPLTRRIADARWSAATRRVVLAPLTGPKGGAPGAEDFVKAYPTLAAQARAWSEKIGPKASPGEVLDGPWKEWILTADLKPGGAVNYGLRREDGSVWQKPGRQHDASYADYSQLYAPVDRRAQKDGKDVDLVQELARGAPELLEGGPLPAWLVEVLR